MMRSWLRSAGLYLALPCWLGACLTRENVGAFEEPCRDPAQAATVKEREVCIAELVDQLSGTHWIGEGRSGELIAPILFEFGSDGSYRVVDISDAGDGRANFGSMFLSAEPTSVGTYELTDLVRGAYFGRITRPLGGNFTVPGDLERLVLDGDELWFSLRFRLWTNYSIATEVVLRRER